MKKKAVAKAFGIFFALIPIPHYFNRNGMDALETVLALIGIAF